MDNIDAVIFDCDGVLLDSEAVADEVVLEYCAEHYPTIDFSAWAPRMAGVRFDDILAGMERELPVQFPADAFATLLSRLDARLHAEVQPIAGVDAALRASLGAMPKAVVSNGNTGAVRRLLDKTGLLPHFAHCIVGADRASKPKPAPDGYLLALSELAVRPPRSVAIEDSVTGVTAATAAGLKVIGFVGGSHCGWQHAHRLRQAGADSVIDAMEHLEPVLRAI